jgi:3'-5' exoribonuclease
MTDRQNVEYGLYSQLLDELAKRYDLPVEPVLKSALFAAGYGSHDKHHAYAGGLLIHTGEVVDYCMSLANDLQLDKKVLLTAAIWHDYAKIYDYDHDGNKTEYRSKIRHVAGSYAAWMEHANKEKIDGKFFDAVGHCILAHHGRHEWGSPVEPQTEEALILHQADMWSASWGPGR